MLSFNDIQISLSLSTNYSHSHSFIISNSNFSNYSTDSIFYIEDINDNYNNNRSVTYFYKNIFFNSNSINTLFDINLISNNNLITFTSNYNNNDRLQNYIYYQIRF